MTLVGAAHAPSPDVRCGLPGLRSLDAVCAPPGTDPPQADWSLAALAGDAGSRGMGNPALPNVSEERFARELTRSGTHAAREPGLRPARQAMMPGTGTTFGQVSGSA